MKKTDAKKLKRCPFCKDTYIVIEAEEHYPNDMRAVCVNCGATGPSACETTYLHTGPETPEEVWNLRLGVSLDDFLGCDRLLFMWQHVKAMFYSALKQRRKGDERQVRSDASRG